MLEDERHELSVLRDELRATTEEAERLAAALSRVGWLMSPAKPKPERMVHSESARKGGARAKSDRA